MLSKRERLYPIGRYASDMKQPNCSIRKYVIYILTVLMFLWILKKYTNIFRGDIESRLHSVSRSLIADDDSDLVAFVRKHYIVTNPSSTISEEKADAISPGGLVDYLMKHKFINSDVPGYFVEVGGNDGLRFTSTLYLEFKLGWTGLVVEPVSTPFLKLVHLGRKAALSNATISSIPHPNEETFHNNPTTDLWGGLTYRFYKGTSASRSVLTIPLYTLLLAAESPKKIDLMILDIEGTELEVLGTVPFDKIQIQVIVVETYNGKAGLGVVEELLLEKGYKSVGNIVIPYEKELFDKVSTIIKREDVHSEYHIFTLA